jgi:SagB-type dehydrogenase family enzyme
MPASPRGGDATGARAYHEATRHSWQSIRAGDHFLDWEIKPFPFKVYPDAPADPLPREVTPPAMPALEALARGVAADGRAGLDRDTLGRLLFFSAGVTKRKVHPLGDTVYFRAAASTGALYEIEVYVVAAGVPGLTPGVYHFAPGDFTLRRLRDGDYRAALAEAASEPARVAGAPATAVLTAIYWRNTWKYQARAYRHFFWDAGTMLANLLATAVALDVPARALAGFADEAVNRLLGLDARREGSLLLVPLGTGAPPPPPAPAVPDLDRATLPLSAREVDYPLVRQAYRASALPSGAAAAAWVAGAGPAPGRPARPPVTRGLEPGAGAAAGLGEVILRRASTRTFAREPITFAQLSRILDVAVADLPLDVGTRGLVDTYLLVHAVDGLPAGAYAYDPDQRGLRELRTGDFRETGGYLCLEQGLGADASAVAFFLADLDTALARHGDRAYRVVNLVAGLYGGRMYLAAYALGLGASGLTFYDEDVAQFFSPDAASQDAIFVTALGRPYRGRPPGLPAARATISGLRPGER